MQLHHSLRPLCPLLVLFRLVPVLPLPPPHQLIIVLKVVEGACRLGERKRIYTIFCPSLVEATLA